MYFWLFLGLTLMNSDDINITAYVSRKSFTSVDEPENRLQVLMCFFHLYGQQKKGLMIYHHYK